MMISLHNVSTRARSYRAGDGTLVTLDPGYFCVVTAPLPSRDVLRKYRQSGLLIRGVPVSSVSPRLGRLVEGQLPVPSVEVSSDQALVTPPWWESGTLFGRPRLTEPFNDPPPSKITLEEFQGWSWPQRRRWAQDHSKDTIRTSQQAEDVFRRFADDALFWSR